MATPLSKMAILTPCHETGNPPKYLFDTLDQPHPVRTKPTQLFLVRNHEL